MGKKGKHSYNFKDLSGQRFGRLIVVELAFIKNERSYWICKCDCGAVITRNISVLKKWKNATCKTGCTLRDIEELLSTELHTHYRHNSKNRGLKLELNRDEFRKLIKRDCYYCGDPPTNIYTGRQGKSQMPYNGIDRKDSNLDYTIDNCVPCCKICNYMKRDTDYSLFLSKIKKIYERFK